MARVKLEGVYKHYGKVEAVTNLNIDCRDREFLCLLGPSGCGKSSTLRMIAGLEHITKGKVYIDGRPVNDVEPHERDIAMVFENYALYPHKTVFENMAYPLRVQRFDDRTIREKVVHAGKILDIEGLLDRMPKQLSGGQKQRVAIGRAIVRSPKVFLLDEPISHLDAKLRTHMRGELKRLHRDLDATMIYVTHDQLEGMTMADRIAVLNLGVLQQLGTPDEVFNHPSNKFVAGFMGDPPMNFIPSVLKSDGKKVQVEHEHFSLTLPDSVCQKFARKIDGEMRIDLGVRPESFELFSKEPSKYDIAGKVYITEPLGEDVIINITIGEDLLKAKTAIGYKAEVDGPIWMKVKFEHIHLFDGDSGESLLK